MKNKTTSSFIILFFKINLIIGIIVLFVGSFVVENDKLAIVFFVYAILFSCLIAFIISKDKNIISKKYKQKEEELKKWKEI